MAGDPFNVKLGLSICLWGTWSEASRRCCLLSSCSSVSALRSPPHTHPVAVLCCRVPMEQTAARGHLGGAVGTDTFCIASGKTFKHLICLHLRSPSIQFRFVGNEVPE